MSGKQLAKLDEIHKSLAIPKLRGQNRYGAIYDVAWNIGDEIDKRFLDKYGVSYDDIHNFDK